MKIDYLNSISKSRSFLMGIAIIWVYMLHSPKTGIFFLDFISSLGWSGVDIFIFLSSVGLCFSLNKNSSTISFFKRRFVRIIPTWVAVLIGVHIIGAIVVSIKPELPFHYPHSLSQLICWYTGIGYWISGFVSGQKYEYFYEWYIPTLLLFYSFAPYLFKQRNKTLVALFILSVILTELISYYQILYYLHFTYQRIPIFILGFIVYRYSSFTEMNSKENYLLMKVIIAFFMASLVLLFLKNGLCLEISKTVIALFMLPLSLFVLSFIRPLFFINLIGTVSLELYLVHLYGRPQYFVSLFVNNILISNILAFFLCLLVAYILHILMKSINDLIVGKLLRC